MKKSLVVLAVFLIVALCAFQALAVGMYDPERRASKLAEVKAAPLKASGEITFSGMMPADGSTGATGFANEYLDITAYPSEYTTFMIEVKGAQAAFVTDGALPLLLNYWQLQTDVGKLFDLGIGLTATGGQTDFYSTKYEVTGLAYERTLVRTWIDPLAWYFTATTSQFAATFGTTFGPAYGGRFMGYVTAPKIGPAMIEAWYMAMDATGKGRLGGNVKATGLMNGYIDFAGGFIYDLRDKSILVANGDQNDQWAYGVGATVKYDKYRAGVSLNGRKDYAVNQLGIDARAAFTDKVGFDLGLGLSLANKDNPATSKNEKDVFQGLELSFYVKDDIGSKWSAGYDITKDGFVYVAAVGAPRGGFFINYDLTF